MSSNITTSGRSRARDSNSLRAAQAISGRGGSLHHAHGLGHPGRDEVRPVLAREQAPDAGHRLIGRIELGDPRGVLHDLHEGPVRDALAVGQAPAPEDPAPVGGPAGELLDETRLADPGRAQHGEQQAGPFAGRAPERALQQLQLVVPADHGRVQVPFERLHVGQHLDQPVRPHGTLLALQREWLIQRFDHHGRASEAIGLLADQGLARGGGLLQPGRGVHGVPGGQPLAGGRVAGHDLAGVHAGSGGDGDTEVPLQLLVQRVQGLPHVRRGPQGPEGVVLVEHRHAEHGHHGIADELLDGPPVALHHRLDPVEVPPHDPAEGLRVEALPHVGGPRHVGEQDGHGLADLRRRRRSHQRGATPVAEPGPRRVLEATARTHRHRGKPTARASRLENRDA